MLVYLDADGNPISQDIPEHISFDLNVFNPLDTHSPEEIRELSQERGLYAQDQFDQSLQKLLDVIDCCDPVYLLGHFAYYDYSFHDTYRPSSDYIPVEQHQIEFLQALILTLPPESVSNKSFPSPAQRLEVNKTLHKLGPAFALKRLSQVGGVERILHEQARSHTQAIRNAGTEGQVLQYLKELFAPLDSMLADRKGVTFTGLIAVCDGIKKLIVSRVFNIGNVIKDCLKQSTVEQMVKLFNLHYDLPEEGLISLKDALSEEALSKEQISHILMNYSEVFFHRAFIISLDEMLTFYPRVDRENLKRALFLWSHDFGSLRSINREHVFLNNPVWRKPLIQLRSDVFYWPIFSSFISFGVEMLEDQIEFQSEEDPLRKAYLARRAEYTEDKAAQLLASFAPGARILRNLVWADPNTGESFENDILVLFESQAIIVECKSGKIKDSARRGSPLSLNEDLKKLIQEPTEQGYKFEQYLKSKSGRIYLQSKSSKKRERIDLSQILRFTRLNILLDYIGPLATRSKFLRQHGILSTSAPPAATMALPDLENFLYLVEDPTQRIYYLHSRAVVESSYHLIADEMDLTAYYLAGWRWPDNTEIVANLYGCSQKIDPCLIRRDLSKSNPKIQKKIPRINLHPWWESIHSRVKTLPHWSELGIYLLNFPYEDQEIYAQQVELLLRKALISPRLIEDRNIVCAKRTSILGPVGIACFVTNHHSRERNSENLQRALGEVLAILPPSNYGVALVVSPHSAPYNIIGMGAQ